MAVPTSARVLRADADGVVRRVRQLVALDADRAGDAARAEPRVGVAEAANRSRPGAARAADLELDALAGGAADVGDEELRRHRRVRHVQLQVVPVDVEDRGVGGDAAARPERLDAALDVPGLLLVVGFAAGRRRRVEPARLEAAADRRVERCALGSAARQPPPAARRSRSPCRRRRARAARSAARRTSRASRPSTRGRSARRPRDRTARRASPWPGRTGRRRGRRAPTAASAARRGTARRGTARRC